MKATRCTGHLCFWGNTEYFEVKGRVWEAPMGSQLDPDGYPHGAKSYVYRDKTPAEFMKELQEAIDEYPDGYMWNLAVHPEEHHLFKHPDPDGDFLTFYTTMKATFPRSMGIYKRGSRIKVQVPEDLGDQVRGLLEAVPGYEYDKRWGGYDWATFPIGSIRVALDQIKQVKV